MTNAPVAGAYPLSFFYSLAYDPTPIQKDCCLAQEFAGFIDFLLYNPVADSIAIENFLVPLTNEMNNNLQAAFLENLTCTGNADVYDAYLNTLIPAPPPISATTLTL